MKIIFDKKEEMDSFLRRFNYSDYMCVKNDFVRDKIKVIKCGEYDSCAECMTKNIDITYVKDCTECANTGKCANAYYRGDLVNKSIKCNPKAK